LPENLLSCLLSILNLLFSSSFPAQWSHSIVHLIPKAHRSGFRPISLTSTPTFCNLPMTLLSSLLIWILRPRFIQSSQKESINSVISALRDTWWGADPNLLLNIYKSMVCASFEYASLLSS
ncbi:hypothetical protein ALC60_10794, partial [Trachymyrmex zeteki]